MDDIVIINYSAGNIFSVQTACRRLGFEPVISDSPGVIAGAAKVIIPGVGSSGSAMESLRSAGLTCMIPRLTRPVLGICLGMQLMYSRLDESDETGLKIFDGRVSLFPSSELPVPHMAWNRATNLKGPLFRGIDDGEWFYFVHSYMAPVGNETIASCNYGESFAAAASRDNFFGCQFHPEKSGDAGLRVIKNFLEL